MVTQAVITSGNDPLGKKSFTLNGAGTSPDAAILPADPILEGLGVSLEVRHHIEDSDISAAAGLTSPAGDAALPLVKDGADPLLFTSQFVAGSGPTAGFTGKKGYLRVTMRERFGGTEQTVVERQLHVAALPDHAVQALDTAGALVDVNLARFPSVVPTVDQHLKVRLFADWADEFSIRHFGGSAVVSVFSRLGGENGTLNPDVLREVEVPVEQFERVVLTRDVFSGTKVHQMTFRFRSVAGSGDFVDIDVDVKTDACVTFLARGPEFPGWVVGT